MPSAPPLMRWSAKRSCVHLFEVYAWDVNFGGVGIGDTALWVLLHDPAPAERLRLAQLGAGGAPDGQR